MSYLAKPFVYLLGAVSLEIIFYVRILVGKSPMGHLLTGSLILCTFAVAEKFEE